MTKEEKSEYVPQVGDVVEARGKVSRISRVDAGATAGPYIPVRVDFDPASGYAWFRPDDLTLVSRPTPPIAVGDVVSYGGGEAEVIGVHGEWAWLKVAGCKVGFTRDLCVLKRVPR